MEEAASALEEAASACLLDVRDRGISYGRSDNCASRLDQAATVYISIPGMKLGYEDQSVPRHAYIAAKAQKVAWSAAALSNAFFRDEEPVISIW